MTFANDSPLPPYGWLPGDRGSPAVAALYGLRVLPVMLCRLGSTALDAESAERADLGDCLVWLEAAIDAIAMHQEEQLALLRLTPLDRICRN